jgi:hypothetical protein
MFMGRMVSEPAGSNHDELVFRPAISALDDDRGSDPGGDRICRFAFNQNRNREPNERPPESNAE